jgi:hexulose-6-phosphate isomerase
MKSKINRRSFLASSAISSAAIMLGCNGQANANKTKLSKWQKALIVKDPLESEMAKIKAAGFDGVEVANPTPAASENIKKIAENTGLRPHSVLHGWAGFNSTDFAKVNTALKQTFDSIESARILGADNILLVPGRINVRRTPNPWDFKVKFDKTTGYITSVSDKDNDRYAKYISEHNRAYDACQSAILKLIPAAEKAGVVIAVENVWNNMFVDAEHTGYFIDSFKSPWVKFYFDIGNHVKYSPPEHWIKTLGKRIVKCHVKDFKLKDNGQGGSFVDIRDGSVDWPVVTKALEKVGYKGWMTIEGNKKLSLQEKSKRLDLIINENAS